MKKFFTLMALGAMASSTAFAFNPTTASEAARKASPAGEAMIQASLQENYARFEKGEDVSNVIETRSWTDANGNTYELQLSKRGLCFDLTTLAEQPEYANATDEEKLEMVPFYWVEYYCDGTNAQGKTVSRIALSLFWPAKMAFNQDLGENKYNIVAPEEFANPTNVLNADGTPSGVKTSNTFMRRDNYFFTQDETTGWYTSYGFTQLRFSDSEYCTINTVVIPYDQNGGPTNGSNIVFDGSEPDDDGTIYTIMHNITVTAGGKSGTFNPIYVGTISNGLVPQHYVFNIGNVGVWYMGNQFDTAWDDDNYAMYHGEWGPLAGYYMGISSDVYSVQPRIRNAETNEEITSGPFDYKEILNYSTVENAPKSQFNIVRGVFFAKADGAPMPVPADKYTVVEPTVNVNAFGKTQYLITPKAGDVIPSGYDAAWSSSNDGMSDGLYCGWHGKLFYPRNPSFFHFYTTKGLGVDITDDKGNTYKGFFTGTIRYARNPENMYDYNEVSAIGDQNAVEAVNAESDINIYAANGEISIYSDNDAAVAVYALNGAIVANGNVRAGQAKNIVLGNGMYIVKVGNKSQKVVL